MAVIKAIIARVKEIARDLSGDPELVFVLTIVLLCLAGGVAVIWKFIEATYGR